MAQIDMREDMPPSCLTNSLAELFPRIWEASTADSNLTLHGFRRFKTTHLVNLRYLEAEIAEIDHLVYQLGLSLHLETSAVDRLGLKYCKRDQDAPIPERALTADLIQRLRQLLKEYDDALISFNSVLSMETFSLLDDKQSSLRSDLSLGEKYKTRLLRIDQGQRVRQDPLQRWIHKALRGLRYYRVSKACLCDAERCSGSLECYPSSQNTTLAADILSRVVAAIVMGLFLIVPLAALSEEPRKSIQLGVISVSIIAFACLVTIGLRASNLEMMVVSAAYAAILSVFVSNNSV